MSNFLRTESEKILMEALKSSDNSSGRNILRDDDDSWYKIPYQITFGEKFNTVKEAAQKMGISRKHLYNLLKTNKL